jgi:hypothetical protein
LPFRGEKPGSCFSQTARPRDDDDFSSEVITHYLISACDIDRQQNDRDPGARRSREMKSWVVLLSIKVAVITLSSSFSLIFIPSLGLVVVSSALQEA